MLMNRTYNGMLMHNSFEDRYEYLKLHGHVGEDVFGFNRYLNQGFYSSKRWKSIRARLIIRDEGCDLACPDRPIYGRIHIHHIVPVTIEMLEYDDPILYDLNNLVCTSENTHRAIHYGDVNMLEKDYTPRRPGDTKLW